MITQEQVRKLFKYSEKTGELIRRKTINGRSLAGSSAGHINAGYMRTGIDGKHYRNHRIIFLYHHGYLPDYVDHIDTDKLNNRIENLRKCTAAQNCMNAKKHLDNTVGVKGIYKHKRSGKFVARFSHNGNRINVGSFKLLHDAKNALTEMRERFNGEFTNHG